MGGAAIAGDVGGPGSIYYNPSLITGSYQANFSFNASLGSVDRYEAKNLFGNDVDIGDTKIKFKPRFFSLFLRPKSNPRISLELASFSKDEETLETTESVIRREDYFETLTGEEILNGYLGLQIRNRESWYGLGGSYLVSDKFSVGASWFVLDKNARSTRNVSYNVYPRNDTVFQGTTPVPFFVSSIESYRRYKISNFRSLLKFGASYNTDVVSLGATITTPSLNVINSGESARSIKLVNIPNEDESGFQKDFIVADAQDGLPATLKDPWSFAFGLTYHSPNKRTLISASTEFFTRIGAYKAIEAEVNPDITSEEIFENLPVQDFLSRVHGGKNILNFAVGFQRVTKKGNSIMTGFRTDYDYIQGFNYEDLSNYSSLKSVSYNVYHVTFGGQFKLLKNMVIAGVRYSFGSDRDPFIDLVGREPDPPPPDLFQGTENATFTYMGLSLFAGFTLNFGQDVASYLSEKIGKDNE